VTHEYTFLVGGIVIPGGGEPDARAIAWAGGTVIAIGTEPAVRAISRGDSHVIDLGGAWVIPLGPGADARFTVEATLEVGGPADLAVLDRDPRLTGVAGSAGPPTGTLALIRGGLVVAGGLPGEPAGQAGRLAAAHGLGHDGPAHGYGHGHGHAGIGGYGGRRLAARLGPVGVWSWALQRLSAAEEGAAARRIEAIGYPVAWVPETLGNKEFFSQAAILLAATDRLVVASGIANIHARDPMAMANGARGLGEAYPGRLVLGLGVSHAPSVAARGGTYGRPVETMRAYLDAMAAAAYGAPEPDPPVPIVLAALGPRMLDLAAERTDGAHPYFVPVEHTAFARQRLGPKPCLVVEQTAVLAADASEGRRIARAFAKGYLGMANYANNLRRMGWSDADLAGDGSDRLIDAVVAWGDVDAIARRVRAHLDAGADQVCIQLRVDEVADPAVDGYRELAAALLEAR
jgi:probable F420-dependent oxidoreductase